MSAALIRFSWGLLWVLVDIRIGHFDLVMDVVGYLLMRDAIANLGRIRPDFLSAKPYLILLAVLSLFEVFPLFPFTLPVSPHDINPYTLCYGSITLLLTLLMMERFLTALKQHTADIGHHELAKEVSARRAFYACVTSAMLVSSPFQLNYSSPPSLMLVFVGVSILGLLATLSIFFICRRAAKQLY